MVKIAAFFVSYYSSTVDVYVFTGETKRNGGNFSWEKFARGFLVFME